MKSKRLPQNSHETNQSLAEFAVRGGFSLEQASLNQQDKVSNISEVLANCFDEGEEEVLSLKHEFSAKTISFVISNCRRLLQEASKDPGCWSAVRTFLEDELWKFSRIKEELAEAQRKSEMVRWKLDEIARPKDGQVSQKRVLACAMLLAETEMRREHLQDRVSMIIDQFVMKILAGTQSAPGGNILELRLRGVFGSL